MKYKVSFWGVLFFGAALLCCPLSEASIVFNEILSDPAAGLPGDANNDGVRSGTQDEFVELFNQSLSAMDLSGWSISDSVNTRHIFPVNSTIEARAFLVVFGGGAPNLSGINWQTASSGSLGLNNSSDTITLRDGNDAIMDQVAYGAIANSDQSISLSPDGEGTEFYRHSTIDLTQGALFSPGTSLDARLTLAELPDDEIPANPVVPELPTLLYFALGWAPLVRNFRP